MLEAHSRYKHNSQSPNQEFEGQRHPPQPNHQFYVPEHAIEETESHVFLVVKKTGLSPSEIRLVLSILLTNMQVVPLGDVLRKWNEAEKIMVPIDKEDTPFMAAALALRPDGIWSDDKHFKRQSRVKVWSTKEIIKLA